MNTTIITIQKAQKQFSHLLQLASQGNEVVITKDDVPFVRLVPVTQPRVGNLHKGAMQMKPDFNDPLPDEFWLGSGSSSNQNSGILLVNPTEPKNFIGYK